MRYLFDEWGSIKNRLKNAEIVLILLDYDGTLSPIVSRPGKAILDKGLKKILVSLSRKERINIGIVSGRRLADVKRLVGISGIYYVGNHGLEIKGPHTRFVHPASRRFSSFIKKIKKTFNQNLKDIKGVIIEDKGLTLTLHYRLVKKKDLKRLKGIFHRICAPYITRKRIRVSGGRKSWEIRPPVDWNKGKAIKLILANFRGKSVLPVYMGDDVTDEDAFRVLKRRGLTVFIGKSNTKTNAKYNLKSVSEVKRFLKELHERA